MSHDHKIEGFDELAAAVLSTTTDPSSDGFLQDNIGIMLEHCKGIAWSIAGNSLNEKEAIPDIAIYLAVGALDVQLKAIEAMVNGWVDARGRAKPDT